MRRIKFLLMISMMFLLGNCGYNFKHKNKDCLSTKKMFNENINSFRELFFSDSTFQISRIIFPLESDRGSISTNNEDIHPYNKKNWIMLRSNYFKDNDSIENIEGQIFKRRIRKDNNYYEESVFIEDSGFSITMKFKQIGGKWHLVDYIECDN
jgi:hypothetical protein